MKQHYSPIFRQHRRSRLGTVYSMLMLILLAGIIPSRSFALQRQQIDSFIELSLNNTSIKDALKDIERQTDYRFVINNSRLEVLGKTVTASIREESIRKVLNILLEDTDVKYAIRKKQITLMRSRIHSPVLFSEASSSASMASSFLTIAYPPAQDRIIKGTVTDDAGVPLPGVNVLEKGTTSGTVTDTNGAYSLTVSSADAVLVFSFIGYTTREIALQGQSTIDVQMETDAQTLSEVVVVGYGTQEKKDVTGSISSVRGSEIQNLPVAGPTQALQGRAAGVNVVRNGGAPGNGGSIRIRGVGTVNNADPLIIIDGVPAGGINDVNPNDVESIEVLKDASSSAIYGTRAANGVVIVTTKRGKFEDNLKLNVSGYTGVSNRIKTIDVLDAPTLAMLKRERYTNDGDAIDPIWEDPQYQTQLTDWQDEILGQGTVQNLDVSVTGGAKRSSFAISGGYYDEKGMIKNSYFKRYSFRINSDHKISDRFKIGQSLQITNQKENAPGTLSAQDGLLWSAIRFHPGLPARYPDGTYSSSQVSSEFGDINNPVFTVDHQDREYIRNRILGSVNAELEIFKGLKAKANIAIDATYSDTREFQVKVTTQTRQTPNNSLYMFHDKSYNFLQEYFLSYDKALENHMVSVVGGVTAQTMEGEWFDARQEDFGSEVPEQRYFNSGPTGEMGINGNRSYNSLLSYFGRANYAFKDKYLFTATFRADGSSKFSDDNKWGYFPAFSAGWRVSQEPFFQGLTSTISSLKVTGGWGELGNQNIPPLQYIAIFSESGKYSFGGQPVSGIAQTSLPNPDVKWERTEMMNFGIETGLLQDQLLATISYFIKDTKDMLLSPPSLGSNGTITIPFQNVGEMRNQGLEIELSYRKTAGDLTYSIGANAAFIRNKVTKLYNGSFIEGPQYGRTGQVLSRTMEQNPVGTFYGWRTDGLYQNDEEIDSDPNIADDPRRANGQIQPGDVRFVDLNGDHLIDNRDRQIIGNPQPKITYGLNGSVMYKGFDLNLFFVGVGGVDIYNADRMQGIDPTYHFNMYAETVNRWQGEGTSNTIPRMSTRANNGNYRASDMFVESGAFLRLKNITLGYTIPQQVTEAVKLSRARVYITGQNVFTITDYSGMDPERGIANSNIDVNVDYAQYPQARTWTIGAALTF